MCTRDRKIVSIERVYIPSTFYMKPVVDNRHWRSVHWKYLFYEIRETYFLYQSTPPKKVSLLKNKHYLVITWVLRLKMFFFVTKLEICILTLFSISREWNQWLAWYSCIQSNCLKRPLLILEIKPPTPKLPPPSSLYCSGEERQKKYLSTQKFRYEGED